MNDFDNYQLPELLPAYDDGIFKAIFTRPESKIALIDIIRVLLSDISFSQMKKV
jgi:hypothetical protein